MNNYSIILPIIIAATLGAGALYLSSGNDNPNSENKIVTNNYKQPYNQYTDQYSNSPQSTSFNSTNSNETGQEAYIGGLTKRHKNKHMKKKSRSSRSRRSKKSKK
jgi:hypothetical protein